MNFVAPVDDRNYLAARPPEMRVKEKGEHPGLPLANGFAGADWRLHHEAAPLLELYQQGYLAIVHACGLVNASRSHFDAQDMMERGIADQKNLGLDTGWLARVLAAREGQTVLIVSHVTPIKTLVAAALLAPPAALYLMHLDVAALSEIDWYADGPAVLRSFNDTGHLTG